MSTRLDDLQTLEDTLWSDLQRAATDRGHPWRVAVLATTDGVAADARSVVLRDVDSTRRALIIYTDSRSPKVQQLQDHPRGTLVMWWPARGWQLRLRVLLAIETSGLAVSSRWARLKMSPAAQDYLSPLPPGSPLQGPADSPAPARGTREHFGVVTAQVLAIDWLELHADGHRRACFDADGARWLTP